MPRWREEGAGDPSMAALAVGPNGSLGGDLSLWCPFLLSSRKPPAGRLSTLPGPWPWGPLLPQAAVTGACLGTAPWAQEGQRCGRGVLVPPPFSGSGS